MIFKLIKILLILIILVGGVSAALYFTNDSFNNFADNLFGVKNDFESNQGKVISVKSPRSGGTTQIYQPSSTATPPVIISLSAEEFQNIIQKSPFSSLPESNVIMFSFFDGNGNLRSDMNFIIKGGKVTKGIANEYDFRISTGDYYINKIKASTDFCATLKEINGNKDFAIEKKISMISILIKYRTSIKTINDCLGGII